MKTTGFGKFVLGLMLTQPVTFLLAQQQPPQQYDAWGGQQQQQFAPQQLSTLVAPIALYPDALLAQVLVAATYPMELQQAAQWLQSNGNLGGPELVSAASQQPWDASVQALVVFPDVISRMTSNMQWTTDLGNAFLAQQGEVMNAVQQLRAEARANGRLASTPQQNVIYQDQGPQSSIEIEPTDPGMLYVPNYNPEYVWGAPDYGYAYPALYYPRPAFGFGFGYGVSIGSYFGGGFGWRSWGWHPNWYGHAVVQNNAFFSRYRFNGYSNRGFYGGGGSATWAHNPQHRMGVPYSNRGAGPRYGGSYGYNGGGGGARYSQQQQAAPRVYNNERGNRLEQQQQRSPNSSQGRGFSDRGATRSYQPSAAPARGSAFQSAPRNFGGGERSQRPTPSQRFQSGGERGGGGSRPSAPSPRPQQQNRSGGGSGSSGGHGHRGR